MLNVKISNATIKKIVQAKAKVKISDDAADAIAKMLEKKATMIARFAVKRAKKERRDTVEEEDIDTYRLKFGG